MIIFTFRTSQSKFSRFLQIPYFYFDYPYMGGIFVINQEDMKNSKGQTLPQPYLALAEMRRAQQIDSEWVKKCMEIFYDTNFLTYAFHWAATPEKRIFWEDVSIGLTPAIPAASLAELEAWEKAKEMPAELHPAEPDYKAMYDELCKRYKALDHNHNRPCQDYDFYKHRTNVIADPTTSRNWIAECAMRVYTNAGMNLYDGIAESWDFAQKWAAEGKKRGHIQ